MCERNGRERVVGLKLVPIGDYDLRYVPVFERDEKNETVPGNTEVSDTAEIETPDQIKVKLFRQWFRENGNA